MQQRFNIGKTFLLGFGFFGVSVIWGMYNAFVPLFLANKFGFEPWLVGLFMTLDNIAALFIQPSVGAWSDRLRTSIGRRMPFILIGAPIGAAAFGLIPLVSLPAVFLACTVTLILSMALWRTPVVALMPDITPSKYRSQANGIINFMGGLGAIISFLIGSKLYDINQNYPFWLASALVLVSAVLVFIFIKEPKVYEENPDAEKPNPFASVKKLFTEKDGSARRILFAIFFWFIAYNAIEAFFTLYANKHLLLAESAGVALLGQLSLIFVLFALPSGFLGAKIGRKWTISLGICIMMLSMLAMFVLPKDLLIVPLVKIPLVGQLYTISIPLMTAGMGWAFININSLPMVVDLTDPIRIGIYTGLYYLFSTFAAIIGPNVNGWIVQLTGNNYASIMVIGPVFMALALVMMLGVKRGEAQPDAAASNVMTID